MPVNKQKVIDNLNMAVLDKIKTITPILDRRLIDLYDGDIETFTFEELGLSTFKDSTLRTTVINAIKKIYREVGWIITVDTTDDHPTVSFK